MGDKSSYRANEILDAAELLMKNDGYSAVTLRRIAESAGVKPQLIYYYFTSIEELMVSAFIRRARLGILRIEEALTSEKPLHALWLNFIDSGDSHLSFEYMALANQNIQIREEVKKYVCNSRRVIFDRLVNKETKKLSPSLSIPSIIVLMDAISLVLKRESGTGITESHDDVIKMVESVLELLEPK